jgi:hypothetical protein
VGCVAMVRKLIRPVGVLDDGPDRGDKSFGGGPEPLGPIGGLPAPDHL